MVVVVVLELCCVCEERRGGVDEHEEGKWERSERRGVMIGHS